VGLHPFRHPFGAAFIITKGAVWGISDPSHLIIPHVAKLRDLLPSKEKPGVIPSDFKKLFLVKLHGVLLSLNKGLVVVGKHASQGQDAFAPMDFRGIR
jgi:hypothetical protein